jgi:hypothetical protein
MQRSTWLWPTILLLATLATWVIYTVWPAMMLFPLILLCFLSICPGMALVRFLYLQEPIAEWTLVVAVSLTLDALVASVQLYSGHWSPGLTMNILMWICIGGAFAQLLVAYLREMRRSYQRVVS